MSPLASLDGELVHVAPEPALPWLEGANHGMVGRAEVSCRMLVLRAVAASDVTTLKAGAQMHPAIAELDALIADRALGLGVARLR